MTSKAHALRLLTATAAAATLTITGAAQASPAHQAGKKKPKPVCHLIKAAPKAGVPSSLQVIGGDVASNKTTITVAIRVTKLTTGVDTGSPLGRDWKFQFVSGPLVTFEVMDGPFGTTSNIPGAHITLDATRNEIRMSAAVSSVLKTWPSAQLTPGKGLFTGITAHSSQAVAFPGQAVTAVSQMGITYKEGVVAISPRSYLAGTPSCLKVGS